MNKMSTPRLTTVNHELTVVMQLICCFIHTYSQQQGLPPTLEEIGAWVGLARRNQVSYYLWRLADWGYLTLEYNCQRSAVLTEAGKAVAARWRLCPVPPARDEVRRGL